MGLSDPFFLFIFLPVCLGLYALAPARLKNPVLVLASLIFYLAGSSPLVMLASAALNWALGLAIARTPSGRTRSGLVGLGVAANLGILTYSKYLGFLLDNLSGLGLHLSLTPATALPLGVSFFTFQAIAYLMDVGSGKLTPRVNPLDFLLFTAFFPKVAAGPITRMQEFQDRLNAPGTSLDDIGEGAWRFAVGLGKKVILAGSVGPLADAAFAQATPGSTDLPLPIAWLGLAAYGLQLYFDFAGYTDMAVGLGRMFGFRLPENFDRPYSSRSIQEFWRRWHMSLSFWFRDYLYIPLGGNRHGEARTYLNLLAVFALCGLWHGASWGFVFWGLLHGLFLALERMGLGRLLRRLPGPLAQTYAVAAVMFAWIFFRAPDMASALTYLHAMIRGASTGTAYFLAIHATPALLGILTVAAIFALTDPWPRLRALTRDAAWIDPLRAALVVALLVLCAAKTASTTFAPFIYARF